MGADEPQRGLAIALELADDVDQVLWRNPVAFYGQSVNLVLDPVPGFVPGAVPAPATFAGSSVLRGARA